MGSATAPSADDSVRSTGVSNTRPITVALDAQLKNLNPEIARKVRAVVNRK
jgi:hypothetical protein